MGRGRGDRCGHRTARAGHLRRAWRRTRLGRRYRALVPRRAVAAGARLPAGQPGAAGTGRRATARGDRGEAVTARDVSGPAAHRDRRGPLRDPGHLGPVPGGPGQRGAHRAWPARALLHPARLAGRDAAAGAAAAPAILVPRPLGVVRPLHRGLGRRRPAARRDRGSAGQRRGAPPGRAPRPPSRRLGGARCGQRDLGGGAGRRGPGGPGRVPGPGVPAHRAVRQGGAAGVRCAAPMPRLVRPRRAGPGAHGRARPRPPLADHLVV